MTRSLIRNSGIIYYGCALIDKEYTVPYTPERFLDLGTSTRNPV